MVGAGTVLCDQGLQGLAGQHRDVAVGDQHLAGQPTQVGKSALDRVPGAVLLLLDGGADVRGDVGEVLQHLLPLVTDHDHQVLGFQRLRGVDRVAQHGMAAHLVQQLRLARLHARPTACGEDDDR